MSGRRGVTVICSEIATAVFVLWAVLLMPAGAQSLPDGDPRAGRALAHAVCAACHGMNGLAVVPQAANLVGRDAAYLSQQVRAFRAGDRRNPFMSPVALGLTDQQIADAAAYYAGLSTQDAAPK